MEAQRIEESFDVRNTSWSLTYRLVALTLALGFWVYYVGRHPFDATGGWRYLTNWGHSANLLALGWALGSNWVPRLQRANPILPVALTLGTVVVILYWSLYLMDPALVNGKNPLPWYSDWYMHLGSTVTVYIEAFLLNKRPKDKLFAMRPLAAVALLYIVWADRIVPLYNSKPCGLTTTVCGYPYPFLNDLTAPSRIALYLGAVALLFLLCLSIMFVWTKVDSRQKPGS